MTIYDKIRDEKLQYCISRESEKISVFSSGKIYKHHYVLGEEILPSGLNQLIQQANFTYTPLGKAFEKNQ